MAVNLSVDITLVFGFVASCVCFVAGLDCVPAANYAYYFTKADGILRVRYALYPKCVFIPSFLG